MTQDTRSGQQAVSATGATERTRRNRVKRRTFLDHLAASANVKAAAAAAGTGASYFYGLRRTDPGFGTDWDAALAAAYDRLEEALIAHALSNVKEAAFEEGAVALELVDGDVPAETDPSAGRAPGDARRRPRGGVASVAGLSEKVARVDVQVALAVLNRRDAIARRGRERPFRRASAAEVERTLNAQLDRLARRVTPLGDERG